MKTTRYRVRFMPRDGSRGFGDLAGFLDMLRYDQCRVMSWDRIDDRVLSVDLLVEGTPAIDRWRSFGIVPEVVA